MVLGYITAALFLLTAAKFITKRLPYKRLDASALKIHKAAGLALLAVSSVHAILVWKLMHQRPPGMYIAGFVLLACILAAVLSRVFMKKLGRKWLKIHRAAAAVICLCLTLHIVLGVTSFAAYQKAVASITFSDIDVGRVADGVYEGDCDVGYIYAKVSVTVKNGKILSVDILEHRNERGTPAEKITGEIVSAQSLDVDAVSGATNSSKVIRKAAENALAQGIG
ncbi:Uncharacterized protein, contains FMN-binding domain [Sporobacter termitidis DSM 10068]|uniref:Uncharacterized protein, contains FMN-binding domain n=1 Tax=Sporobacter termitidis DSM 10068 TaxID=1123282 RepID=A0A1M5Z9C8_9FIRM|nr:FMN-binding protein [Sporobacter termitidis]SHI20827.1 Uncharacterized protein, contains FMN-binding domain [Sporobacter termitidis DSM 10068]